jgi:hypothetical protein
MTIQYGLLSMIGEQKKTHSAYRSIKIISSPLLDKTDSTYNTAQSAELELDF